MIRKLYIQTLCRFGKAIDIHSKGKYPANVLSNFWGNSFNYDGVDCASMEGFLQALKHQDTETQRHICQCKGKEAKELGLAAWRERQIVYWKGKAIDRHSSEFSELVRGAYQAMFEQNQAFHDALISTRGKRLYHSIGVSDSHETILTEHEFCSILTELRDNKTEIIENCNNTMSRLNSTHEEVAEEFLKLIRRKDVSSKHDYCDIKGVLDEVMSKYNYEDSCKIGYVLALKLYDRNEFTPMEEKMDYNRWAENFSFLYAYGNSIASYKDYLPAYYAGYSHHKYSPYGSTRIFVINLSCFEEESPIIAFRYDSSWSREYWYRYAVIHKGLTPYINETLQKQYPYWAFYKVNRNTATAYSKSIITLNLEKEFLVEIAHLTSDCRLHRIYHLNY